MRLPAMSPVLSGVTAASVISRIAVTFVLLGAMILTVVAMHSMSASSAIGATPHAVHHGVAAISVVSAHADGVGNRTDSSDNRNGNRSDNRVNGHNATGHVTDAEGIHQSGIEAASITQLTGALVLSVNDNSCELLSLLCVLGVIAAILTLAALTLARTGRIAQQRFFAKHIARLGRVALPPPPSLLILSICRR